MTGPFGFPHIYGSTVFIVQYISLFSCLAEVAGYYIESKREGEFSLSHGQNQALHRLMC